MRLFSSLALLLFITASAAADERERAIPINGMARHYTLITPSRVDAPLPLLIVYHGGGQTAERARSYTRFDTKAESGKWVVVYPEGISNNWNDGRKSADISERASAQANDVEFTRGIIDQLAAEGLADRRRVFLTGASNGGMMAMYAACKLGAAIRGMAPVVANQPVDWTCNTAGTAALFIHGTLDDFMPYQGGKIAANKQRKDLGTVLSADQTIERYKAMNGCTDLKEEKRIDNIGYDKTVAVKRSYTCSAAPLMHIVIEGGGHTWPGARTGIVADWILGATSKEVNATDEILSFFAAVN